LPTRDGSPIVAAFPSLWARDNSRTRRWEAEGKRWEKG